MNLATIEIKAFIPATDYETSKQFYQDLGFSLASDYEDEVTYYHFGNSSFLLQNFDKPELANNLMMSLLVEDVDSWYDHVLRSGVIEKYKIRVVPPQDQPWQMRDFVLFDPSGVLWRIGQNLK
jgi:uncharacterized glyoxalase superfamily protein PhnB